MTAKTRFMIAAAASIVVVRDGERKTIQPGGGDDFTEDEIAYINAAQPGALRKPVNEGNAKAAVAAAAEDDDAEDDTDAKAAAKAKPATGKAKAKTKPKADDSDEDEDI